MERRRRAGWDVDHVTPTFSVLVKQWVKTTNRDPLKMRFNMNKTMFHPECWQTCESWQHFHKRYAKLAVISSSANRSKGGVAAFGAEKKALKRAGPYVRLPTVMT